MGKAAPKDYQPLLVQDECLWERPTAVSPTYPHVRLPVSGLHSEYYFRAPIDNPNLMRTIAYELFDKIAEAMSAQVAIDKVVGPERETVSLVNQFTLRIQDSHYPNRDKIRTSATKKLREGTPEEDQEWLEHYTKLTNDSKILVLENVVTTGITAAQTVRAIYRYAKGVGIKVEVLPIIGCIFNRTAGDWLVIDQREFKLISYLHKQPSEWSPAECPLCKEGSVALDPRTQWDVLMNPL